MHKKKNVLLFWVKKNMPNLLPRILLLSVLSIIVVLFRYTEIILLQTILERLGSGATIDKIMFVTYILVLFTTLVLPLGVEYYSMVKIIQPFTSTFSALVSNALYFTSKQQFEQEEKTVYIDIQTKNLSEVANAIVDGIIGIANIVQVIWAVCIFASVNILMTIAIIFLCVLYIGIGKRFTIKLANAQKDYMDEVSVLHQAIEEASTLSREILSYNSQEWEKKRRKKKFAQYYRSVIRLNIIGNNQYFINNVIRWAIELCILFAAAAITSAGIIPVALFVTIYRVIEMFLLAIENIFSRLSSFAEIYVKLCRIKNVCETNSGAGGLCEIPVINSIEFQNVKFSYTDNTRSEMYLNFTIPCGKKIGVVGESGNGKTTLLNLFAQIISPDEGEILVNGKPLTMYSKAEWQKRVAICHQNSFIFSDTVENNICIGRKISNEEMIAASKAAFIHEKIESMKDKYKTVLVDNGVNISGGERKRIALARILLSKADFYLFDEVTASIPHSLSVQLMDSIMKYLKNSHKTYIIVTHRLSLVKDADLILVMDKGRIVANGKHEELKETCEVYRKLLSKAE